MIALKTNIIDVVKEMQTMYENELPLKFSREHNKFEGCSNKQIEKILKQAKGNWVLNRLLGIIFPSQMESSLWLSRTDSFSFFYNNCIKWLEDNSDTESFFNFMLYIDQALCAQESIREECELGKWVADRLLGRI